MPTLQVISHEQDPGQKQMLDASNQIAETIQKAQAMNLTGEYYKILKKHAETEEENAKYERLGKANAAYQDIAETTDPNLKATKIEGVHKALYKGDSAQGFHDLAELNDEWAKRKKQLEASQPNQGSATAGQLAGAQANKANAEAGETNARIPMYRATTDFMTQQMNGGGTGGGAPTDGGDPNAPAPGFEVSGFSGGMPTFTSPRAKYNESKASAIGTDMGKRNIAQNKFDQDLTEFDLLNSQIPRASGGFMNRVGQGVSNYVAGQTQDSPAGNAIRTYEGASKRLATTIARQTDVGNLSETEQNAAARLVPTLSDSKPVNDIKMAYIHDINRPLGSRSKEELHNLIAGYQTKIKDANNPDSPRAQAIKNLGGQSSSSKALDANTARGFLQQAGGDKAKARDMAKQAGYSF